jgi:hypothetical protein
MGTRPAKPAATAKQGEINRVAIISDFERIDPAPDELTLLKRSVDAFDVLEVDDFSAWELAVADVDTKYQRMFQGGQMDRLRFRYYVYGLDNDTIEALRTNLDDALTP